MGNKKKILGSTTPRQYTKPLRKLTPMNTRGYEAIEFSEKILGLKLLPWQKWLLKHLLEIKPDGSYRFRTVIVEVARQNGKTTLAVALCLWRMFMDDISLVLGTAQNLETSKETWEEAVDLIRTNPELAPYLQETTRGNGKVALKLTNGAEWKISAISRKGGRSRSADVVLFDELREHTTWEAWAAIANTTMARGNALILGISNAGDASSIVLKAQRDQAIKDIERGTSLGYFGWTAPEDAKITDRKAWAAANPGLGYVISEDALIDAARQPEAKFRTENLCQWVQVNTQTYIDSKTWQDCLDEDSQIAPNSDLVFAIDTSADRRFTSIAVAGWRTDGLAHIEIIACRAGMMWVQEYAKQLAAKYADPVFMIQARGCPAAEFIEPFEYARLNVRRVQGFMLGAATGQFRDRVEECTVRHINQPALSVAVSGGVTRRLGEAQAWDRTRSENVDIAPLVAASWALYGLANREESDPVVSAYSSMSNWWIKPDNQPQLSGARSSDVPWWA